MRGKCDDVGNGIPPTVSWLQARRWWRLTTLRLTTPHRKMASAVQRRHDSAGNDANVNTSGVARQPVSEAVLEEFFAERQVCVVQSALHQEPVCKANCGSGCMLARTGGALR